MLRKRSQMRERGDTETVMEGNQYSTLGECSFWSTECMKLSQTVFFHIWQYSGGLILALCLKITTGNTQENLCGAADKIQTVTCMASALSFVVAQAHIIDSIVIVAKLT